VDRTRWIDTPGARLWSRRVGDGTATPLAVPGAVVDEDLETLASARPVIFYDSRNRGRSDPVTAIDRLGFWAEVADAETVRSDLGLERASWLGWSYLAGVVIRHALAHPVRVDRLVLVAPIGPGSDVRSEMVHDAPAGGLARLDQLRAAGVDRTDPERFCEAWHDVYDPMLVADPGCLAARRSRPCRHANEWPARVTSALAHVFVDLGPYDWRSELAALEVPTLVVHGGRDPSNEAAASAWVSALPDARLLVIDDVCRLPWLEAPAAFFGAVEEFLAGAWPAGARR
jgi:proline iminopeptidase